MDINGVTENYSVYRKNRPAVTFVVNRKVVSPVMFRNSESDRAETHEFDGRLHAQVNPEKFVSQERVRGLHLLRHLSDNHGEGLHEWDEDEEPKSLIADSYTYNEPGELSQSVNMDSLTYGVAGTDSESYSIKSHVVQGYAYSMNEYDIVDSEVRNAVYESGTMRNEDGEQSDSLYNVSPVSPGNEFVSFVTVEAGTPSMILYVLHNLLNTGCYGARETRHGKNIENEVVAVVTSPHPHSLSSGELLMDFHDVDNSTTESIENYLSAQRDESWEVYSEHFDSFREMPDWYENYRSLSEFEDEEDLYDRLLSTTIDAYETLLQG